MLHRCEITGGFSTQKCPKALKTLKKRQINGPKVRVDSLRTGLLFPPTDLYIIMCGSIRPDTPSLRPQADVSLSSAFLSPERGGAGARPSPPPPAAGTAEHPPEDAAAR